MQDDHPTVIRQYEIVARGHVWIVRHRETHDVLATFRNRSDAVVLATALAAAAAQRGDGTGVA